MLSKNPLAHAGKSILPVISQWQRYSNFSEQEPCLPRKMRKYVVEHILFTLNHHAGNGNANNNSILVLYGLKVKVDKSIATHIKALLSCKS